MLVQSVISLMLGSFLLYPAQMYSFPIAKEAIPLCSSASVITFRSLHSLPLVFALLLRAIIFSPTKTTKSFHLL